jgi:hypothetical protein
MPKAQKDARVMSDDEFDGEDEEREEGRCPRPMYRFATPSSVRDSEELVAALAERKFEVRFVGSGGLAVADLAPRQWPRSPPSWLASRLWDNAGRVGRWLERKGVTPPQRDGAMPPDCRRDCWSTAQRGLERFIADGWASQATALGWTVDELFRVPRLWSQISRTGAALMIGNRRVIAVSEDSIVIETLAGSHTKFRRIGREHIA